MIAHQNIGMDPTPIGLSGGFKALLVEPEILLCLKDHLPIVASLDDMLGLIR